VGDISRKIGYGYPLRGIAFEILAEAKIRRFFEEKRARGLRPFFDPALALPWALVSPSIFSGARRKYNASSVLSFKKYFRSVLM
jgi:hypothetical protein